MQWYPQGRLYLSALKDICNVEFKDKSFAWDVVELHSNGDSLTVGLIPTMGTGSITPHKPYKVYFLSSLGGDSERLVKYLEYELEVEFQSAKDVIVDYDNADALTISSINSYLADKVTSLWARVLEESDDETKPPPKIVFSNRFMFD